MLKIKQENIYFIFILLIIVCIYQYGSQKVCGFSLYPDEFGYWATAAEAVGYNWTEVASLGSYYSFGYSLLLIPLLKIFKGGVIAYRAAITLNMFFLCVSMFLISDIICRIFPKVKAARRVLISGVAVLYPAWVFYMHMTLVEALIMFLFVLIVWVFICMVQNPRIVTVICLAVLLVYLYCVHMRTVGVFLACCLTLLVWGLTNPAMRKQMIILIGVLLAGCCIILFLKRNTIMTVFSKADTDTLIVNDYGSQLWKIKSILTLHGMKIFLGEIIAKIFYLGIASFGCFYWAMGWCLRETVLYIKRILKKGRNGSRQYLAVFLLLSVIGEILICSIYMHGSNQVDSLVYGRYDEFMLPVLMAIGIRQMLRSRRLFLSTLGIGTISGIMLFPILSIIRQEEMNGIRGFFVTGISYLLKEGENDYQRFFIRAWIMGFLLMILAAGIIWSVKRWKNVEWILGLFIVMEVVLGFQLNAKYTFKLNEIVFQDLTVTEKIKNDGGKEASVTYIHEGERAVIDFCQMQLYDMPIHVVEGKVNELAGELGDYVIVIFDSEQTDELEKLYNRHIASCSYILYYNKTS